MRVLVVGGTGFLGRHVVEAALAREHELTLFDRGISNPGLFPELERLHGDRRRGDLGVLEGRAFDAVIDTCGYFPAEVEPVARLAAGSDAHYTFVSSISVYADPIAPGTDESGLVSTLVGPVPDEITTAESYGALKALCERAAEAAIPGGVLSARSGLIAGPHDPTDRLTYWPRRIAEGGRVLAAEPDQRVQLIDARDLAEWIVESAERGTAGVFNATGPAYPLAMGGLLDTCARVAGEEAEPVWAGDAFLEEHGVEPWSELPLWVPTGEEGFCQIDCSKAIAAGLRFRPLEQTVADTLAWDRARPAAERVELLARERECELLALLG